MKKSSKILSDTPETENTTQPVTEDDILKNVFSADSVEQSTSDSDKNAFFSSLADLKPDDICEKDMAAEKKPDTLMSVLRFAVMAIFASIFLYCVYFLIRQQYYYRQSSELSGNIQNEFWDNEMLAVNPAISDGNPVRSPDYASSLLMSTDDLQSFLEQIGNKPVNAEFEKIKAKLNSIKQKSPDLFGWIKSEGTEIDYPFTQYTDNDFYLTHNYMGAYSPAGSVFADYRCSNKITENYNTVMYAHHMASGSTMFHTLDYYFKENFFNENPYIYIYTLDGIYTFEVFAVYKTNMYYKYIRTSFASGQDFVDFAEEMRSNSLYVRDGITFDENDHLLTLSTCTNIVKTDRITVQAKLIKIEK